MNRDRYIKMRDSQINKTRIFVVIMGTMIGFVGICHGIFETIQGNKPTEGYLLKSIGAFTIIQNYFLTGIVTITVGVAIIGWTIFFIHKKKGPIIFLFLSIILFLVGGGIAHILFFVLAWLVSTRINKPAKMWIKIIPVHLQILFTNLWLIFLIFSFLFFVAGIIIWILFLPPGLPHDKGWIMYTCWSFLGFGLIFQILTILAGFVHDFQRKWN
jgi:hypothetical protein